MDLTIKKANNGYIISQKNGEDIDILQTEGAPSGDREATIDLLYVVAAWAGIISEDDNKLFIAFDEEEEGDIEDADNVEEDIE